MIRRNLMCAVKRAISSIFSWDFSRIGYTSENTILLQQFEDAIAYSEEKARTFTPSKVTSHFKDDKRLVFAPMVDTSKVTSMSYMFQSCIALASIPQLDTSKVTIMGGMFQGCTALASIPQLDTSKVTIMGGMFQGCTALASIPQLDTSIVTSMSYMFKGCTALASIPQLDTSKVTIMDGMFQGCTALASIPQLDTSIVTSMSYMFKSCTALASIPQLDMYKVKSMTDIFQSCSKLVFALIKNIGKSTLTTYNFSGASNWGTGGEENRQSLIDSLITYSYDRASNGMPTATIKLSSNTKALLTAEEIAQIEAKGFTIA